MASFSAPFQTWNAFIRKVNTAFRSFVLLRVNCSFSFSVILGLKFMEFYALIVLYPYLYLNQMSLFRGIRLFERGLVYVGTDYLSHPLWDKYIEYEELHAEWGCVAMIYARILEIPNRKLDEYFNR